MERQISKAKGRKYWTPEEDRRLVKYFTKRPVGNWKIVSPCVGKSASSCYQRWHNHLAPGVNGGEFTDEEKDKILGHFNLYGRKWATIARHFPGRTANHIKNFVNTHLAKKARQAAAVDSASSAAVSSPPASGGEAASGNPNVVDYQPLVGNNGGGADYVHVSPAEFSPPGGRLFGTHNVSWVDSQQVNGADCEYLSQEGFNPPGGDVLGNPSGSWIDSQKINGADCVYVSQAGFYPPGGGVLGNPSASWVDPQQVNGADCEYVSQAGFYPPGGGVLSNPSASWVDSQKINGADCVYLSPAEFSAPGGGDTEATSGNPNIDGEANGSVSPGWSLDDMLAHMEY